jgi:pimeloyl-ACP methyl ester carboxylesterase
MARVRFAKATAIAAIFFASHAAAAVALSPRPHVHGIDVAAVDVRADDGPWRTATWDALGSTLTQPGGYELRFPVAGGSNGATLEIPHCAGRRGVSVDGSNVPLSPGPVLVDLAAGAHEVSVAIDVSRYERRIACGQRPRVGARVVTREGLGVLDFDSPYAPRGGGLAVVYVPPAHDLAKPSPLLVGLHPWNGTMWTYAAYAELLQQAAARDVLLLLPSGLGNSLYTADAEDEALRAIDALAEVIAIDPRAVSLWGASMGGAGATTIGFHRPDRFASVTSFFGDSKYDLTTYVRSLLPDEAAAHRVNALDVVDNAAHMPVWLVHGEEDRTSPIRQSAILAEAMQRRGFPVTFDRVPGMGHEGALVARFLPRLVALAATARTPDRVSSVTYRSVRPWDDGAYGVHAVRRSEHGDALVEVARREDGLHITRATNARAVVLDPGAFGTTPTAPAPIVVDVAGGVTARWAARMP